MPRYKLGNFVELILRRIIVGGNRSRFADQLLGRLTFSSLSEFAELDPRAHRPPD